MTLPPDPPPGPNPVPWPAPPPNPLPPIADPWETLRRLKQDLIDLWRRFVGNDLVCGEEITTANYEAVSVLLSNPPRGDDGATCWNSAYCLQALALVVVGPITVTEGPGDTGGLGD